MSDTKPEHTPGNHVLVAGVVHRDTDPDSDRHLVMFSDGHSTSAVYVRDSDVSPASSAPDPRDAAIAAIRESLSNLNYNEEPGELVDRINGILDDYLPTPVGLQA